MFRKKEDEKKEMSKEELERKKDLYGFIFEGMEKNNITVFKGDDIIITRNETVNPEGEVL